MNKKIKIKSLKSIIYPALPLFFVASLFAEDITWTGSGTDSSWSTAENWSPESIPTSSDDVSITVSETTSIVIDGSQSASELTLSSTNAPTITGSSTVGTNTLSLETLNLTGYNNIVFVADKTTTGADFHLDISGDLNSTATGYMRFGGTYASDTYAGNFSINVGGTLNVSNSKVTFYNIGENKSTINNIVLGSSASATSARLAFVSVYNFEIGTLNGQSYAEINFGNTYSDITITGVGGVYEGWFGSTSLGSTINIASGASQTIIRSASDSNFTTLEFKIEGELILGNATTTASALTNLTLNGGKLTVSDTYLSADTITVSANSTISISLADYDVDSSLALIQLASTFTKSADWESDDKLYLEIYDYLAFGNEEILLIESSDLDSSFTLDDFEVSSGTLSFDLNNNLILTVAAVPEPSTYALIFGILSLGFVYYRKRK